MVGKGGSKHSHLSVDHHLDRVNLYDHRHPIGFQKMTWEHDDGKNVQALTAWC